MSEKIRDVHLNRTACVYIRQSTNHQVRYHQESRHRQYALMNRATELGFREVVVIDDDLGISGSGSLERPGFGRLLTTVCEGRVGAVLALEASRLARNSRDWHHLIDLCCLTGTLVIDDDGVYDPGHVNDRLLLGLKGTMSEFELNLLRQRAQEALRSKIRRGEVLTEVPIGYVRTENNHVEMTPDRQVQEAIRGVFSKFREMGSARQVLLWYRQERIPVPTCRRHEGGTEIVWRLPIYHRILAMLKNPIYAGAFAYGRICTKTTIVNGRARKTRGHEMPRQDWEVLIRDHHAGYIPWEEYIENQNQLEHNAGMRGLMRTGAAKRGSALLAGLLRCGECGRKLHVAYSGVGGKVRRYHCRGAHINHETGACISFGGLRVDEAVAQAVLEALRPAGIELSLDAWCKTFRDQNEKRKALELALEKAQYEADRARRQYDLVDPENRLVAAELEARWNAKLQQVAQLKQRLDTVRVQEETLSDEEHRQLVQIGEDLEVLWSHPKGSVSLKKRILRTVLKEIVVQIDEQRSEVVMHVHWAGGVHTHLRVPKNRTGRHGRSTDGRVTDMVKELVKVCDDAAIAGILNRLGYKTGAGNTWTEGRVRGLRRYQSIPVLDRSSERPWVTLQEAGEYLNVSPTVVRRLIKEEFLPAEQVVPHAPWIIERDNLRSARVQAEVRRVREKHRPRPAEGQITFPFISTT